MLESRLPMDASGPTPRDALLTFEPTEREVAHGAITSMESAADTLGTTKVLPFDSPIPVNGQVPERIDHGFFTFLFSQIDGASYEHGVRSNGPFPVDVAPSTEWNWFLPEYTAGAGSSGPGIFSQSVTLTHDIELPGLTLSAGDELRSDYEGLRLNYDDPASYWYNSDDGIDHRIFRGGRQKIWHVPSGGLPELIFDYDNVSLWSRTERINGVATTRGTWWGQPTGAARFSAPISAIVEDVASTLAIDGAIVEELDKVASPLFGPFARGAYLTQHVSFGYDHGDAPASYGAAWHDPHGPMLGTYRDGEMSGRYSSDALGDDSSQLDDEDGVTFGELRIGQDTSLTIEVSEFHPADTAYVSAWIDFNRDGRFGDDERLLDSVTITEGGTHNFDDLPMPGFASEGITFARVRISGGPVFWPDGHGGRGEVEDYAVELLPQLFDFGDAPDSYGTTFSGSPNPARHDAVGVMLGTHRDSEVDGMPTVDANGDDLAGTDDEDGVRFSTLGVQDSTTLYRDVPATVTVTVTNVDPVRGAYISGWIDDLNNGSFSNTPSRKFADNFFVTADGDYEFAYVPRTGFTGPAYVRVRVAEQPIANPVGPAGSGEVEDYRLQIADTVYDFGDAPDPYRTTLADNGPRHIPIGVRLGTARDFEPDAANTLVDATGDDVDGIDDEDGVVFAPVIYQGEETTIEVTVTDVGPSGAYISGWLDRDAFGFFSSDSQSGEVIVENFFVTTDGTYAFQYQVPTSAAASTYARFRVSSVPHNNATPGFPHFGNFGELPDGEVEDYAVAILPERYDFGDAPDVYRTSLANDGARHRASGPRLGNARDIESDAAVADPGNPPTGDDTTDIDDEDGVLFNDLNLGSRGTVSVNVQNNDGQTAYVSAFIDYNNDGIFTRVLQPAAVNGNGWHTLTLDGNVASNALLGNAYARVRISTNSSSIRTHYRFAPDGEVEDAYAEILPEKFDFGDAPESYGRSQHRLVGVYLGDSRDGETAANYSVDASGDDLDGIDDEDGVTFSETTIAPGQTVTGTIQVSGITTSPVYLFGWVDLNGDGQFHPVTERIINRLEVTSNGLVPFEFTVPSVAAIGTTHARFRVSRIPNGLPAFSLTNPPLPDGETEDYSLTIVQPDVTPPASEIDELPRNATSKNIPLSWTFNDPAPNASGVTAVEIQVAIADRLTPQTPWSTWQTFDASTTSAIYPAESLQKIWFRSVAIDAAGNREVFVDQNGVPDESKTLPPDTFTNVGDFDPPDTSVVSANVDGEAIRVVVRSRNEWPERVDVYARIDGGSPIFIGQAAPTAVEVDLQNGVTWHSGELQYIGPADSTQHTFTFFSRGTDASGNTEAAPAIDQDVSITHTFVPQTLRVIGFDVNQGQTQRSHIHTIDVSFNTSDQTVLQALIDEDRLSLERFALDATSLEIPVGFGDPVSLSGASFEIVGSSTVRIHLGNTISGVVSPFDANGFYRLRIDTDRNGTLDLHDSYREFFRSYGDLSGDGRIDDDDQLVLNGGVQGDLAYDLNGDGRVDLFDAGIWNQLRGMKLFRQTRVADGSALADILDALLAELSTDLASHLDD